MKFTFLDLKIIIIGLELRIDAEYGPNLGLKLGCQAYNSVSESHSMINKTYH